MKKIDWHRMKENSGLKLLALFVAILIWFFVSNIDDPIKSAAYNDIPIVIKNEELIKNDGKTYKIMDNIDSVRVVVNARRSVLRSIRHKDITAIVDFRQRDPDTGIVPITAEIAGYEESVEVTSEVTPNNILVRVEGVSSKYFPISVSTTNKVRDGYELGEMTVNPERVQISGAKSAIEDIQRVVARINVNGKSEDCVLDAELIIFDGNGNPMDQSYLSNNLGEKGVSVNVQILPSKEVGLKFNVSGTPAPGYRFTRMSVEPDTIPVYGTKEDLENLKQIEIPAREIDISGATSMEEYTIDISPYLPKGIKLDEETASNVVVTVMIEQEGTRTFLIPVGSVQINNLDDRLKATMETKGELEIHFTGEEKLLEKLDIENAVFIDLRGYEVPGTYEIPINIDVGTDVAMTVRPSVTVTLSKKEVETAPNKQRK